MFNLSASRPKDAPCLSKTDICTNTLGHLLPIRYPTNNKLTDIVYPSATTRRVSTPRPMRPAGGFTESVGLNTNTVQTTKQTPTLNGGGELPNEYSTTKEAGLLPWMQDVLDEYVTTPKSNTNENQVFQPNNVDTQINNKPIRSTTVNSFWSEWSMPEEGNGGFSVTPPTTTGQTTTQNADLSPWMREVLNEYSTTQRTEDIRQLIRPTIPRPPVNTEWMQNEFSDYPAKPWQPHPHNQPQPQPQNQPQIQPPTEFRPQPHIQPPTQFRPSENSKLTFGDGTLIFGGGNGDLHLPTGNRYCESPINCLLNIHPSR